MFKKVLSVLFAAALCLVAVAGTKANAATITLPKDCAWIYYDSQWDSYKLTAFNDNEGVGAGTICDDIGTIYALEITVKAASTPDTSVIINAESANWDQHDGMDWADNGDGTYTTVLKKDGPFSLFKTADTYAQICLGAWGAVDIEVVGAKWLDKDGGVIKLELYPEQAPITDMTKPLKPLSFLRISVKSPLFPQQYSTASAHSLSVAAL